MLENESNGAEIEKRDEDVSPSCRRLLFPLLREEKYNRRPLQAWLKMCRVTTSETGVLLVSFATSRFGLVTERARGGGSALRDEPKRRL